MATVLVGALAASIVVLLVGLSVADIRASEASRSAGSATDEAERAVQLIAADLRANPTGYLERVGLPPQNGSYVVERARRCLGRPTTPVFRPSYWSDSTGPSGSAVNVDWPADCGSVWEYAPAPPPTDDDTPADKVVRYEIDPPSASNPELTVRVVAEVGEARSARTATFTRSTPASWTVHSDAGWRLNQVFVTGTQANSTTDMFNEADTPAFYSGSSSDSAGVDSGGRDPAYSASPDYAWAWPSLYGTPNGASGAVPGVPKGVVVEESGFNYNLLLSGLVKGWLPPSWQRYRGIADGTGDVRDVVDQPLLSASLAANADTTRSVSCDRTNAPRNITYNGARRSTQLCLRAGGAMITESGSVVGLPAEATRWLLIPTVTGSDATLAVYSSTSTTWGTSATNGDLSNPASLVGHPGELSSWTPLGTVLYPASGVVVSENDTVLGLCSSSTATSAYRTGGPSTCRAWDTTLPGSPGAWVRANLTLIAGTGTTPADVFIGGPVGSVDSARIGVFSYGTVLFPHWARPAGGDLTVAGTYAALGRAVAPSGYTRTSPIGTFPSTVDGTKTGNRGGLLTIAGGISTPAEPELMVAGGSQWRATRVDAPTSTARVPSPNYPAFDRTWRLRGSVPTPTVEICGAGDPTCAAFLGDPTGPSPVESDDRPDRPTIDGIVSVPGGFTLTWARPATSPPAQYQVLISDGDTSNSTRTVDPATACSGNSCSWTATGFANDGRRYTVALAAVDSNGVQSEWSRSTTVVQTATPLAPSGLTTETVESASAAAVKVSWTASATPGVTYTVERRNASLTSNPFSTIASGVTTTTYTDTAPPIPGTADTTTPFEYRVTARLGAPNNTQSTAATTRINLTTGTVYGATISASGTGSFTVNWKFSGAAPAKVRIYWSTSSTLSDPQPLRLTRGTDYLAGATTGTRVVTGSFPTGARRWVWVTAEDAANLQSPAANVPYFSIAPSAPTPPTVTQAGPGALSVSWATPPAGETVDSWDVLFDGNLVASLPNYSSRSGNPATVIESLPTGTTYQVTVRASNNAPSGYGGVSAPSAATPGTVG